MKKALATLLLLSLGLNCSATQLYPYQTGTVQQINGNIETNGCNDYITMPSSNKFDFWDEFIGPTSSLTSIAGISAVAVSALTVTAVVDPYIVPIDGTNYVMVKDKNTNDWSEKDLLGIDDPKNKMFLSLRNLESDNNYSKITGQELKKAGIRLVKLDKNGVLQVKDRNQDYSLSKIDYIDMLRLRQTANSKETGIFGHFNVYLKTNDVSKKMVVGYVTFDTHSKLKIMFE